MAAIQPAELIGYASANLLAVVDDTTAVGGVIDLKRQVFMTDIPTGTDDVEVISTDGADTQSCTIIGRTAAGAEVSQSKNLTGTSAAIFDTLGQIAHIQSVELVSDAQGAVTVRRSVDAGDIAIIPIGGRGIMRMFRNSVSESSQVDRFEKLFLKNTNALNDLIDCKVKENDDNGIIVFALEDAVDDNNSVANRKTVPTGIGASGFVGDSGTDLDLGTEITLGTDELKVGEAIGVWLRQRRGPSAGPINEAYTIEISGGTGSA